MNVDDLRRLADRADGVEGRSADRLAEVHARIEVARRKRVGAASAVGAVVVAAALVAGGTAIRSMDRTEEPVEEPTPHPTPSETLVQIPAGQRTVVADIGPGDIGGYDLVASRTNTQPGYEGATDLTLVGSELPWDDPQFCHGDPDTWWVFLTVLDGGDGGPRHGDGAMTDGSRGSFGRCSPDDPTSPQPPDLELDPARRYQPAESFDLRMFVTGPLSEEAQRCLKGTNAVSCPVTHGIEPLAETDAVFGFGDFEPQRTPAALTYGFVDYEALAIADGVEYLVDSAVIAADRAPRLVVHLPASDVRRIVGVAVDGTSPAYERCVERLGHESPGGPQQEIDQMEEATRECSTELRLRVDDAKPTAVEGYWSGVSQHSLVPAGESHDVTVEVVTGDPRNASYALIIWKERP